MDKCRNWGVFIKFGLVQRGRPGPVAIRVGLCCIEASLALCLLAPSACAQLYTGSVSGTVTDPSGAAIPSAHATLTDVEKGFTYTASVNETGRFVLRQIPPGSYAIRVDAPNFQAVRREGIKLDINQNISLDFSLKIGAATETVDVVASAVHLQTEDAVTGQVIDRRYVNDLPLVGRSVLDLAYLTPGITEVDTDCQGCMANNFISNGSRNATADILLDGVSSTNFEQNSGILAPTYVPSVDAVEEFKVQQSNFSAEFGFTGATVVNVLTRSGTNQFHGTLYEFLRNDKLDANDWFNAGNPKPPLRLNDFGGTVGGPIWKKKTFFFFDYEGRRARSFTSATAGVPTDAMKKGDFGELCTLDGNTFNASGMCSDPSQQLWDPYSVSNSSSQGNTTRTQIIPFNNLSTYASPGNPALNGTPYQVSNPRTAGNLIDPVASKLMQMFPSPTQPIGSTGDLSSDWFAAGTNKDSQNQFDIKIDHRFSETKLLSGKYAERRDNFHSFNCFNGPADPCTGGPVQEHDHLLALNYAQTFRPTLTLTLSYGFTRGAVDQTGIRGDFPKLDPVADLGLPAYMEVSGFPQYPAIRISGYNGAAGNNIGTQTFSIIKEGQETHNLLGGLNWIKGKHDLKFGGEMRVHRINFTQPGWPGGQFRFDKTGTSQLLTPGAQFVDPANGPSDGSGDGMASFLIGIGRMSSPQPAAFNGPYEVPNNVATQNFQFGGFVQDNLKVGPKFTLNLGLRYEVSLPRTERFNRMNWLDPNISYTLAADSAVLPGAPPLTLKGGEVFASPKNRYNYDTFYGAIQPRFGFAYTLPHTLVVRGGYGIYFQQPRSGAAGTGPWGYQGFDQQTQWIPSFNNLTVLPGARLSNPFPGTGPKLPPGNSLGSLNDVGFSAVGPIPSVSHNVPYEQAWSFGLQKELPWKIVAEANYVGKKGTHLYLGGFRENNLLPASVLQLDNAQLTDLANTPATNPLLGYITDPLSPLSGATVPKYQLMLPYPQFTGFQGDSPPIANSIYHAAQFRVEKSFSGGLQFLVTYSLSKSIDGASATDDSISWLGGGLNGNTLAVQNPYDLRAERAVSTFDIPQVLQFSYVYSLPVGRGKRFGSNMDAILNGVIGGWQLNGIWRFAKGRPIILVLDSTNPIPTFGQRPSLTGLLQVNNSSKASMVANYFANACEGAPSSSCPSSVVVQPDAFTFGNAPRTITNIRQPGNKNVNMSLFKQFPMSRFREGMHMEFRFEAFNVFNHPNFAGPDTDFGGGSFGQITFLASPMREVQLGLKLYF